MLNDNNAINNSLYLPENNLTSGELFMVYYKEFANYYSFNNSKNTIAHNLSLLKMFFSLDSIKNKSIKDLEKKDIIISDEHTEFKWCNYTKARERLHFDLDKTALYELNEEIKRRTF